MRDEIRPRISHAPIWVNCPASEVYRVEHPEPDFANEAKDTGIACAWAAEKVLKGELSLEAVTGVMGPKTVIITESMVFDIVRPYVEKVREMFSHAVTVNNHPPHIEFPTVIEALPWRPTAKPDVWWLNLDAGICHILDLKAGRVRVDSQGNWQLGGYCVALIDIVLDTCKRHNVIFRGFQCEMVQPLLPDQSAPWFVRPSEVPWLHGELIDKGLEARGENPSQCSGPHCRHCPGRHDCSSARKAAGGAIDYAGKYSPDKLSPKGLEYEYELLQRGLDAIKARLSGVELHIKQNAKTGKAVTYALEESYGYKAWSCDAEIVIATAQSIGVDVAKPAEAVTPTQAKQRGLPESIIDSMSSRPARGLKLTKKDPASDRDISKKLFGETKNV